MTATGTIRVLVSVDRLAEVLGLVATGIPLGQDAKVKVQDPSHDPGRFHLPVRGFEGPRRTPRGPVITGALLGALIGVAATLISPALRGLSPGAPVLIMVVAALIGGAIATARSQRRHRTEELLEFDDPERLRIVRLRRVHDHDEVVRRLRAAGFIVLEDDGPHRRDLKV